MDDEMEAVEAVYDAFGGRVFEPEFWEGFAEVVKGFARDQGMD